MQVFAVAGIVAAFAMLCTVIYLVGRSPQPNGRDVTFVDPRYPDSMQAVGTADITPPGRPYLHDHTSLGDVYQYI
jgi:hypothetical protein